MQLLVIHKRTHLTVFIITGAYSRILHRKWYRYPLSPHTFWKLRYSFPSTGGGGGSNKIWIDTGMRMLMHIFFQVREIGRNCYDDDEMLLSGKQIKENSHELFKKLW